MSWFRRVLLAFRAWAPWLVRSSALALVLASCGPATAGPASPSPAGSVTTPRLLAGQTTTVSVDVDGRERSFLVHAPGGLAASGAMPLVVVLHGGFGSGAQAEQAYGWDAVADREGFLVAYPDGVDRAWNAGGDCCGRPARTGLDDVAFIRQVVVTVGETYALDARRIYAAGMSNGGMLTYRLACETDLFAAVGPVGATQLVACTDPRPVSIMAIHGLDDETVRFDGAPGSGTVRIDGPPVPDVIADWRLVDRCDDPVETVDGAVTTSAAACADGRSVVLVTVAGAGHQWPGAVPASAAVRRVLGIDPPSNALDATAELWAFFAAHPRP